MLNSDQRKEELLENLIPALKVGDVVKVHPQL